MALYNEERPHNFDTMVGQKVTVEGVRQHSIQSKFSSLYILQGQFGSGKTTLARIIALAANCHHKDERGNPCCRCENCKSILANTAIDFVEIDGATYNKVEDMKKIIDGVNYAPSSLDYKVIIIDEAQMLSPAAWNASLKTFEEAPDYVIFILATTDVNKIPSPVRSRAMTFNFKQISTNDMTQHLMLVAEKHGNKIDHNGARLIAKYSDGALRNALGTLEQAMMIKQDIDANCVKSLLGIEDDKNVFEMLKSFLNYNEKELIVQIEKVYKDGKTVAYLLNDLRDVVSDSIVYIESKDASLIENTEDYINSIQSLCQITTIDTLLDLNDHILALSVDIRNDDSKAFVKSSMLNICRKLYGNPLLQKSNQQHIDTDTENRIRVLEQTVVELQRTIKNLLQNNNSIHAYSSTKDENETLATATIENDDSNSTIEHTQVSTSQKTKEEALTSSNDANSSSEEIEIKKVEISENEHTAEETCEAEAEPSDISEKSISTEKENVSSENTTEVPENTTPSAQRSPAAFLSNMFGGMFSNSKSKVEKTSMLQPAPQKIETETNSEECPEMPATNNSDNFVVVENGDIPFETSSNEKNITEEIVEKTHSIEEQDTQPECSIAVSSGTAECYPEIQQLMEDSTIKAAIEECCQITVRDDKIILLSEYEPILRLITAHAMQHRIDVICEYKC